MTQIAFLTHRSSRELFHVSFELCLHSVVLRHATLRFFQIHTVQHANLCPYDTSPAPCTCSVLLWHRSDNLAFVLILGGASLIEVDTGVQCNIKGVLQVIDDVKGPITKKEYELFEVPVGEHILGRSVNFLCQPVDGSTLPESAKSSKTAALLSTQVQIKQREQVNEGLQTGVRALDLLTPLGRGASLLIIGPNDSGKSSVVEDAVLGQIGTGQE